MKKILGSLITALLVVFMFSTTVSAAQLSKEDVASLVNDANSQIEQEIISAQTKANILTQNYDIIIGQLEKAQQVLPVNSLVYNLNKQLIVQSKSRYDRELDMIVNELVQDTNEIANDTIRTAAENGYTVICQMEEVQVGDRIVLIDPLRVGDT